jgi:NTE family protein
MTDDLGAPTTLAHIEALARRQAAQPDPEPLPRRSRPTPEPGPETTTDLNRRVGLALAGGAARGGYHVGVVEALALHGVRVRGVAGTSIGALNGVVTGTAPTLSAAAEDLLRLWRAFTRTFATADEGEEPSAPARPEPALTRAVTAVPRVLGLLERRGLMERMVSAAVDRYLARPELPVWVTAFPSLPPVLIPDPRLATLRNAVDWLRGMLGTRSEIMDLRALPRNDAIQAVLASAALPFLFDSRVVGGRHYRDGMLGGDNLPVRALVNLGYDIIIAVHLRQGQSARLPPGTRHALLDIRPSRPLGDLLDFSPQTFEWRRDLGREDAERALVHLRRLLVTESRAQSLHAAMLAAVAELDKDL